VQVGGARGRHGRLHVGEQERQPLVVDDRLPERLALLRVPHRDVQRALGHTGGDRRDAQPPGVQPGQGDRQPLALRPQPPLRRHPDAVEQHRRRGGAHQAHLVLGRVGPQARHVGWHEEARDAPATVIAGTGHHLVEVGLSRVRRPGLRAVDHVVVAVTDRPGPHRRRVGAGVRLRQAVGPEQLTAEHVRQPPLLLLPRPRVVKPEAAQRVHAGADPDGCPRGRDLLQDLQVDLIGLPAAAVLLRVGQAQQPGPAELTEDLTVEGMRPLGHIGQRAQLLVHDVARQLDEVLRLLRRHQSRGGHAASSCCEDRDHAYHSERTRPVASPATTDFAGGDGDRYHET
jgi:hypothetical protein